VGGASRTVGIVGWPVAHSLSPAIHNAAFEAMELDWVYLPLPVRPDALSRALEGLVALGFCGANITMPHKTEAAARCASLSDDARRLQAVNTIVIDNGELHGHNTDTPGFDRFLRRDAGFDPRGRSALLFGAGGAARAVALALARAGIEELTLAVRDPGAADGVAEAVKGLPTTFTAVPFDDAGQGRPDLVVNATPVGGRGENLPVPELGPGQLVVDLLYQPAHTPLQLQARDRGAAAFGGLGLLLHQAALAFELWTGAVPPLAVMSAAALAELAEHA
jgi:shikimate dehydrogenase